jgi:thiamine biosynthesis lipoprotein
MHRERRHLVLLLFGLAIALGGCGQPVVGVPSTAMSLSGPTMGTWYHVKIVAVPSGVTKQDLQRMVDERLVQINQQMSTYLPESELSRFNLRADADWFPVSPDLAKVVAAAQQVARDTGGAFDVTVGPLVNLWNFGPNPKQGQIPDDEEIAAARGRVDYRRVEVRHTPPALRKTRPDVYVDLSAIAKGFAVDSVAGMLNELGIDAYMVEIGGEVRTRGRKSDGTAWRIGIERPVSSGRMLQRVVELGDDALATSGDYRNYFDWQGRRYSHEIDPRTGRPVEHSLASVSVVTADCMTADALATALIVLGPEQALRFAEANQIDVFLISRQGEDFEELSTPGFSARIRADSPPGEEE